MASPAPIMPTDRQWFIVSRWQQFAGEGRANLLRVIAVASFYGVQLLNYYAWGEVPRDRHVAITGLAVTWTMLAAGVHFCLRTRLFPAWLKFLSTGGDIVLLTSVLTLVSGAASALVVAYFVILALAALRFSLALLWFATGASCAGYVFLLGYARWAADRPEMIVPRLQQLLFLIALVLTGIVLGQVVRRVRSLAEDYTRRLAQLYARPQAGPVQVTSVGE
jgi:hypothetical protein